MLETMEDLKNFCLVEGTWGNNSELSRGPTLKLNPSSKLVSPLSNDDLTDVKRLNKASFVISPNNKALQTERLIPEESECISEDQN